MFGQRDEFRSGNAPATQWLAASNKENHLRLTPSSNPAKKRPSQALIRVAFDAAHIPEEVIYIFSFLLTRIRG